jgi:iron complex outermembrane recepter protein
MSHSFTRGVLTALTVLLALRSGAQHVVPLSPIVVTAHHGEHPLTLTLDPRAPAQPIPAQDGAEVLRGVAGFSVIRKGGIDGDPVVRGMAGSRLGILLDGDVILGGCGNRMDPPTAYVHPASFQRVTIHKGPQSVQHGSGYSAGVVRFEREPRAFTRPEASANASVTVGSFGRNDQLGTVLAGTRHGYVQATGTRSESGDYETGRGEPVHSAYKRWNAHLAAAWTPDALTRIEAVAARGDGEAAYADRGMDGTKFAREHLALHFTRAAGPGALQRIEARTYFNYVDHVMDNYTLRPLAGAGSMSQPSASNPDRRTHGGRILAKLLAGTAGIDVGGDFQANRHRIRSTSNQLRTPFASAPRIADADFRQAGIFAEAVRPVNEHHRWAGGVRLDDWRAMDRRLSVPAGMGAATPNPTAAARRHTTLPAGFLRLERERDRVLAYAGIGYTTRFPDYWELFSKESAGSASAFDTAPERTAQADAGVIIRRGGITGSVSLFANRVGDYILIQSGVRKGARTVTLARNIDAATWGGEATASLRLGRGWTADASVASVRGRNESDGSPLAQQPPLEGRLAVNYATPRWSLGTVLRAVDAQSRIALNQGNIAGQDVGTSPGFAVLSVNAGWSIHRRVRAAAGVDNVFKRDYAEHISRSGAAVAGYPRISRVMEPGRTVWCKVDLAY